MKRNPIYRLAERVRDGELTLEAALGRAVTEEFLLKVDDVVINELDRYVRRQERQDLLWSTLLAVLNCQAAQEKGSDVSWGNCNATLGWIYLQRDELDLALHHHREALRFFKQMVGAEAMIAQIKLDVGRIKERKGEHEAATVEYEAALKLGREIERLQIESDAYSGLGRVYLGQERADDALDVFEQVLTLSRENSDRRGEEAALGNLGRVNHFLGRLVEAANRYREGLAISQEIEHLAGTGRFLSQLGSVLWELGRLEESEENLREALKIARRLGDRQAEQQRLGILGNLYQARARRAPTSKRRRNWLTTAKRCYTKALKIARKREDRRAQGDLQASLGIVYSSLGRTARAEKQYTEALSLAEACGTVDTQWRVYYHWGDLCASRNCQGQALEHYEAAIRIVEAQRDRLEIESRVKFWQERSTLYRHAVLCCLRLGGENLWSALVYAERTKARYLVDLLGRDALSMERAREAIRATLDKLPDRVAVVVFSVNASGTAVLIVTHEPVKKSPSDAAWKISPDGYVRARVVDDFDRNELQRFLVAMDESGKVVGGYLGDYSLYVDCCKDQECRQDDDRRQRLRENWLSTLNAVGAEVYDELLVHLHRELGRLSVKRVVLAPDLGLSLLPLHACRSRKGCLWDDYEMMYAPGFRMLSHCRREDSSEPREDGGGRLLAVSNPTGDLEWAASEVIYIVDLFPRDEGTTCILDDGERDEATRATLATVTREAPNYDYVHFACHGRLDLSEPLQSHLLLAKSELLTTERILESLRLPRTRLVVMSACETGLVNPSDLANEYIGLSGALLQAGARAVIVSLWVVDDMATALLMRRFYEVWKKGSVPISRALWQAQDWLRTGTREQVKDALEELDALWTPWALQSDDPAMQRRAKEQYWEIRHARQRLDQMDDPPFAHPYWWAGFQAVGDVL
jgi:CHAT domain-containing protein/tetratricopeptide (TPR) repeat protein